MPLAILILLLAACAPASAPTRGETPPPAVTASPTSAPSANGSPGPCDAGPFLTAAQAALDRFIAAEQVAQTTPRPRLSTATDQMKSAQEEFERIPAPDCAADARRSVDDAMTAFVNVYLMRLGDTNEDISIRSREQAQQLLAMARGKLADLGAALGTPRP